MDENTRLIITLLAIVYGLVSSIVSFIRGKRNSNTAKALSQVEQRDELRRYMINEIEVAERTATLFSENMDKGKWKKDTVLRNVTLYAKGQGYSWYNQEEMSNEIDTYVEGTKKVNFTESSGN